MKNGFFFAGILFTLAAELAILILFMTYGTEIPQNTVAINEVLQTLESDWGSLEKHVNPTNLDYTVLDLDGTVLYRTRSGLSESIFSAVNHRDTILNIQAEDAITGQVLIHSGEEEFLHNRKKAAVFAFAAAALLQLVLCGTYFLHIQRTVVKPFQKLKCFAERIADGCLDIPLEMDRKNLFGAFTESFDLMRSELKKAKLEAAGADAAKKELVAKLSHDIKTPVASIKAAAEVAAALAADEKTKYTYEQIIQKTDQINTLVSDLFSATLEELHVLSVTPADFKSSELKLLLENADYLHRAVLPPIPECLLLGDRLRLQQVFDNLFANSYKYADTKIQVSVHRAGGCLAVCIEDFGGGVSPAELPLIKEKFKRGSNTEHIEGAGLGLYISDYCMREMQGRLDLENGEQGLKATALIALSSAS